MSLLKLAIKGTYVSVEPYHLSRYVDGEVIRFNARMGKEGDRFQRDSSQVVGKRLTYRKLTGKLHSDLGKGAVGGLLG